MSSRSHVYRFTVKSQTEWPSVQDNARGSAVTEERKQI